MRFMASSFGLFRFWGLSSCPALCRASTSSRQAKRRGWPGSPAMTQQNSLDPRHVEACLHAGAVAAQCALLADRVRALEDPVLPGSETSKDFRFHGLRPDEAQ